MKVKVLITGVGGGVGQSILKSFQGTGCSVVAADAEYLATGLYAADRAYLIPYAAEAGYIDRLLAICKEENCKFIFPGLDAELSILSRHVDQFKKSGITAVVSAPQVVDLSDDKLATAQFLMKHHFPAPLTVSLADSKDAEDIPLPLVLKPMKGGARSKGVFLIRRQEELRFRLATLDLSNYVAQEYLEEDEYTCGSLNFDGYCHGVIVMKRILRDGDTYKAFVINDPSIKEFVKEVAEKLKPFGPCNFQLKMKEGRPVIFEINARCSGTTYSRALAGFNEPLMTVEYLTTGKMPAFVIQESTILRYWKELVVDNTRIFKIQKDRKIAGDGQLL